jgi:hypothetical protein
MISPVQRALDLLDLHYTSFYGAAKIATEMGHPVPVDTRSWSQIIVSVLTGIKGLKRKKGADLDDGSDVKGAITWEAIDTPRFNGVIKAGTKAKTAGRIESLDSMPYLFFVLWDHSPDTRNARCRIWCVRPQHDAIFRAMCLDWYSKRDRGEIISTNFQLHPPRGQNSNLIKNTCGNLLYPLLFAAERPHDGTYQVKEYHLEVLSTGLCQLNDLTSAPPIITLSS